MSSFDKLNRRHFLGSSAAAGLALTNSAASLAALAAEKAEWPKLRPAKLYKPCLSG